MALQKTVTWRGVAANYFRLTSFRWDRESSPREASAIIALYVDAASAAPGLPALVPIAAKLRLSGAQFDAYLAPAVLAAAGGDVIEQLYAAAKAVSLAWHGSEETDSEGQIVSDFGHDAFWDAVDV